MEKGTFTDHDIIKKIRIGDRDAVTLLIRNTEKLVAQIVFKMVSRPSDRKDLTQDIYLKVFKNLHDFRFESKLSSEIKAKYAVYQNKKTGGVNVVHDYRLQPSAPYERIIDFKYYYPYYWENPYAAYLIPKDLEPGDKVYIEDLIEDVVGGCWNQGDAYRLSSCEAIWNGKDFEIQFKAQTSAVFIG